ncbi:alpha/beta hydrolase [Pseudoxanthomonas sp. NC8]|nr:alpha/beta hydrolase [Pseudoxanthomonas sp. NC8]
MRLNRAFWLSIVVSCVTGCVGGSPSDTAIAAPCMEAPARAPATAAAVSPLPGQRGGGAPYEIAGSEVWNVPDPVSGRDYQVFVALPSGYAAQPQRRYPVLYVTDADYAFPLIRQIGRRLNLDGPALDEFILVGLSYAVGEEGTPSRRRDYTPTPNGPRGAPADATHGMAGRYIGYLRDRVLPFVAQRYRTDESQRLFLGHSYGGLLGTQVLLTEPGLFSGYILGSPSYWYDDHYMEGVESTFAAGHDDLPARVYLYVGQYEAIRQGDARYASRHDMVADARHMERSLRSRRYPSLHLVVDVLDDEDHLSVAPRGFTHGLEYLLGTRSH